MNNEAFDKAIREKDLKARHLFDQAESDALERITAIFTRDRKTQLEWLMGIALGNSFNDAISTVMKNPDAAKVVSEITNTYAMLFINDLITKVTQEVNAGLKKE